MKRKIFVYATTVLIFMFLIVGVYTIHNINKATSQETNKEIEEITPEVMTHYPVSSIDIIDKEKKLVKVFFTKDNQEGFIKVYFDSVSVFEYYSQKKLNTLTGERVLELTGINQIRFSPDLDKEIRKKIFN